MVKLTSNQVCISLNNKGGSSLVFWLLFCWRFVFTARINQLSCHAHGFSLLLRHSAALRCAFYAFYFRLPRFDANIPAFFLLSLFVLASRLRTPIFLCSLLLLQGLVHCDKLLFVLSVGLVCKSVHSEL